jgi:hypothetical protein
MTGISARDRGRVRNRALADPDAARSYINRVAHECGQQAGDEAEQAAADLDSHWNPTPWTEDWTAA